MTALTPAEQRAITTCPDCGHLWSIHAGRTYGRCLLYAPSGDPCPCPRTDETIAQVEALVRAKQAEVLEQAANRLRDECVAEFARLREITGDDPHHSPMLSNWLGGLETATRIVRGLIAERES